MSNRVALVTGGGQGIGQGISEVLGGRGFRVAVADLNLETGQATARSITDSGGTAIAVTVDVSDTASVQAAVKTVADELGPVEVAVNNAGFGEFMPFLDTTEDFWNRILDVNFRGARRVTQAVVPGMSDRGWGRVVNIGSDAGRVGSSLEAVYSGAKGGIIAFTKTLAREVATSGITVHAVCPAPATPQLRKSADGAGQDADKVISGMVRAVPMKRLGTPEDVGPAVAFFASDAAAFITGQKLLGRRGPTEAGT